MIQINFHCRSTTDACKKGALDWVTRKFSETIIMY